MMEINRRIFLAGLAGMGLVGGSPPRGNDIIEELYASTRKNNDGRYSAAIFDPVMGDKAVVMLPGRGHDIAVHPSRKLVVAFARRPDRFAVAFSCDRRVLPIWFKARADRHFYGHGVFSKDGKLLYSTENDYENRKGIIGIRDATDNYRQIGEFSSFGVGPHDLGLLSDGTTLVIANGGIETHPDTGREILNPTEMSPNLVYIDSRTGNLLEKHSLSRDMHQLSIRHLDITADDTVVIGCQNKGVATEITPLVGFHKRGRKLTLANAPAEQLHAMKNYIGSVAVDQSGDIAATTSPKGGITLFWDIKKQQYLGEQRLADNCGISRTSRESTFLITSGQGNLLEVRLERFTRNYNENTINHWDNHVVKL